MILLYLYMDIYIYIEKKVYNIEGQLRGLQGSPKWKTCALYIVVRKMFPFYACTSAKRGKTLFQPVALRCKAA
jgi:hypothetical protein